MLPASSTIISPQLAIYGPMGISLAAASSPHSTLQTSSTAAISTQFHIDILHGTVIDGTHGHVPLDLAGRQDP